VRASIPHARDERHVNPRTLSQAVQEAFLFHQHGKLSEAERRYKAILKVDAGNFNALHMLGVICVQQGRHADAVKLIRDALKRNPDSAEAHSNLGHALLGLARYEEAISCCRSAVRLKPDYADAHNNLGLALQAVGRHEEAIASCQKTLALRPDHAGAHNNMGLAFEALNRHDDAIASYRKATALRPDYAEAHSNLGNGLQALLRHEEAIACYERAQAIASESADAHWGESLARLALGDFAAGWQKYEWRWRTTLFAPRKRDLRRPLWLGEPDLAGKRILLHAEQGLGDTLQFARYAPLVTARGGKVTLLVQPAVKPLLETLAGVDAVVAEAVPPRAYDFHCPLLSLPLAFRTTLETVPAAVPYLSPPASKITQWRSTLSDLGRPIVGVAWSGNPTHRNDRNRSIALPRLAALLSTPRVQFVSIQKELRDHERELLGSFPALTHLGEKLEDFADTAAVVSQLDLVVTVDTAAAHLAGSLAKPVWVLLPYAPDWRWLLHREDSPWYPTMRLFRQTKPGDWESVIARVAHELGWLTGNP